MLAGAGDHRPDAAARRRGRRRARLAAVRRDAGARDGAPAARCSPAPPAATSTRTTVNEARVHAPRPVPHPVAGRSFDNHGVDGAVGGIGRAGRRLVRPAAPRRRPASSAPTPCPCSPASSSSSRAVLVGVISDDDFPWLTAIGVVPLRRRGGRRGCCRQAQRRRWPSRSRWASRCVTLAADRRGGAAVRRALARSSSSSPSRTRGSRSSGCSYALGVDGIALVLIAHVGGPRAGRASSPRWHDVPTRSTAGARTTSR